MMQPVTPPPVKNPLDLILAKLHVASNDFFLQLPNIVGGIVFVLVAWFVGKLIANGVRKAFHHKGLVDLGGVLASLTFGLVEAIRATQGKLTYRDLHKRASAVVKKRKFEQVPQLEARKAQFDVPIFSV